MMITYLKIGSAPCDSQNKVTIYLEGLTDMAAFNWLTSMVENNP